MITFTEQDALNGLRQAAGGRGASYIYPGARCVYVDADVNGTLEPACMVGYALACMGVPLRLIYESLHNAKAFGSLANWLANNHGYHFTTGAIKVLMAAQAAQDGSLVSGAVYRNTWGEALVAAVAAATETSIDAAAVNDVVEAAEAITSDAALATV